MDSFEYPYGHNDVQRALKEHRDRVDELMSSFQASICEYVDGRIEASHGRMLDRDVRMSAVALFVKEKNFNPAMCNAYVKEIDGVVQYILNGTTPTEGEG